MARPTKKELEIQIAQLESQREKDLASLEEVKGLLQQADKRRKTEPDKRRKWDQVLENLERGLDETKSRLNGCEVELQNARRALAECPAEEEGAGEAAAAPEQTPLADTVGDGYLEIAQAIAKTPLSEMRHFSLEQIAVVTKQLGTGITRENFPEYDKLTAHLEFANQHQKENGGQPGEGERRTQQALRAAIDKMLSRDFDSMSRDEMRLVLASHELLLRNLQSGPREERLKKLLVTGVGVIRQRLKKAQ